MMHADTTIDPALDDGVSIVKDRCASASQDKASTAEADTGSSTRRKRRVGPGILIGALLTVLLAGAAGPFALFANRIAGVQVPHTANADAIVVLTGGHARVNEAVRLLEEGRANRLLISGVHPGTTREQLAAVTSSRMPLKKSTVELDRVALNTAGNATETASWVRKNGFSSLLVVTSAYHLPRAEVELSGALPDVELIAYPVFSKDLKLGEWYREPATIRLLMREYVKYIVARLRLTVQGMG
ncbi:YdcF family protein [Labrenzia sp. 011]|uniref:YdcF family protein n=1 Tax=Labrenzia sp. 011 TaxID=2171494 RepID=UPI000D516AB1|nr:YdcF family protein [Labrenzia sp. 011]PVB62071.1 YdcF family protein [Labrenzia sp. 011]